MRYTSHPSWLKYVPSLEAIDNEAWSKLLADNTRLALLRANETVYHIGDPCRGYLLVLEGSISVCRTSANGHEILLYHLDAGQACELSTCCLLANRCYPAEARTNTAVRTATIPKTTFWRALTICPEFRDYVYGDIERSVLELIELVEKVAFERLDGRLAQCLLTQIDKDNIVRRTHQELASELGTAREVISRLLKKFEKHGWVVLQGENRNY